MKLRHGALGLIFFAGLMGRSIQATLFESQACKADMDRYCSFEEEQDQEHLDQCLKRNEKKLSAECKAQLPPLLKKLESYQVACAEDLEKLCTKLSFKNSYKSFGCLKSHKSDLSDECRIHIRPQHPFWDLIPQEQMRDDF